jgi:hypothetical protein
MHSTKNNLSSSSIVIILQSVQRLWLWFFQQTIGIIRYKISQLKVEKNNFMLSYMLISTYLRPIIQQQRPEIWVCWWTHCRPNLLLATLLGTGITLDAKSWNHGSRLSSRSLPLSSGLYLGQVHTCSRKELTRAYWNIAKLGASH